MQNKHKEKQLVAVFDIQLHKGKTPLYLSILIPNSKLITLSRWSIFKKVAPAIVLFH